MDINTAEDVNLEEVDDFLDNFARKRKEISCPSKPKAMQSKKKTQKASFEEDGM